MEVQSLFDEIGGRPVLERVHTLFCDRLYSHPWLKLFFEGVDRAALEKQLTDFMTDALGGRRIFSGAFPQAGHKHLFITEEIFDLRHQILGECLTECDIPGELAERWLKADQVFRNSVVKTDPGQCEKRFDADTLKVVPKPSNA